MSRKGLFFVGGFLGIVLAILLFTNQSAIRTDKAWAEAAEAVESAIDSYDRTGEGTLGTRFVTYFDNGGEVYRVFPFLIAALQGSETGLSKMYKDIYARLPQQLSRKLMRPRNSPIVTKIEITEYLITLSANNKNEVIEHSSLIVPGLIEAMGYEAAVSNNCRAILLSLGAPTVPFLQNTLAHTNANIRSASADLMEQLSAEPQ